MRTTMAELLELDVNGNATIAYGEGFGSEEFKLLEVDESTLKELLEDGCVYFLNPLLQSIGYR